jgi:phosphatidylinositol glycan class W
MSAAHFRLLLDEALRREKEAFVTGLRGTTAWEVLSLALFVPLCLASFTAASHLTGGQAGSRGWSRWWVDSSLYSGLVLVPLTLALTAAADHLPLLALLEAAVLTVSAVEAQRRGRPLLHSPSSPLPSPASPSSPPSSSTAFLSAYRVCLLLSTAVAILAVDFPLFPRRLAKTEEFGLSPVGRQRLTGREGGHSQAEDHL